MSKTEELLLLQEKIINSLSCPLKETANNLVFGKGNPDAKIFFIGEAPGKEEDLRGVPFVGRAGLELDKSLRDIGLSINDVYIANILKYRPPNNRDPLVEEIETHTPFLIEQIRIIKPKIIVTLGNYSTKFILGGCTSQGMKKIKGISSLHGVKKTISFFGEEFLVIPLYHPAAMLYNPNVRSSFAEDFLIIAEILKLNATPKKQESLDNFL